MIAAAWMLLGLTVAHGQSAADTSRIVTLGGAVTEIVYALGAGDQIVGVDASSVYPEAATEKPDVGYFREVPAEGVLSLDPSLILALEGTGPPAVLDQFRSAGVRTVLVPDEPSVAGTKQKIRKIGDLLGRKAKADSLIRRMEQDLTEARALRSKVESTPRVLFIYARGTGSMSVAGRGSSAETMIKQPGIPLTPAGKNRRIVAMDDLLLLGFAPRLGTAVKRLTKKLHPALNSTTAASSPQP
jgi:iron complex transport system substrate-binding protein